MDGKMLLIIGALAAVYYLFKSSENSTKMLGLLVLGALGLGYVGNRHGGVNLPGGNHSHNNKKAKIVDKITINTLISNYHIDELYETYCKGENRRKATCQCFVKPLYDDMRTDFSKRQLERLRDDHDPILHKKMRESYNAQQKDIALCLESNNSTIDRELTTICKKRH